MKLNRKYKTLIYKAKSYFKALVFKNLKKTSYSLNSINSDEITIHHHGGLGDAIICNGMINYLSNYFSKIRVASWPQTFKQLEFLYSDNRKIEVFEYKKNNEIYKGNKHHVLRVGFEKNYGNFNVSFYEQLNLPYEISFDYFHIPNDESRVDEIYSHLLDHYGVSGDYILIHRSSSYGELDLVIENSLPKVFVEKDTDIFKNIFLYTKLIQNAKEIHCVDSSFLHLVERVDTEAELFFHAYKTQNQITEKLFLKKNWNIINKKNEN